MRRESNEFVQCQAGYLYKQGKMKVRWSKLYFKLQGSKLLWHKAATQRIPKGILSLSSGATSLQILDRKNLIFSLMTSEKQITLRAATKIEFERWEEALLAAGVSQVTIRDEAEVKYTASSDRKRIFNLSSSKFSSSSPLLLRRMNSMITSKPFSKADTDMMIITPLHEDDDDEDGGKQRNIKEEEEGKESIRVKSALKLSSDNNRYRNSSPSSYAEQKEYLKSPNSSSTSSSSSSSSSSSKRNNSGLSLSSPEVGKWRAACPTHELLTAQNKNNNNNKRMIEEQENESSSGEGKAPVIYDLHLKPIDPYYHPIFPELTLNYYINEHEAEKLEILNSHLHHRSSYYQTEATDDQHDADDEFQMPILVELVDEDAMIY